MGEFEDDVHRKAGPGRRWMPLGFVSFCVLVVGGVADFFGRMDLGDIFPSDTVSYLDCMRAFERGDLHAALNPLWSPGYPALLALLRPAFPAAPEGTWYAAHTLNFLIYAASWIAFVWLARELSPDGRFQSWLVILAGSAFVTAEACLDQVPRIGPDKLVALLFYVACALQARLLRKDEREGGALLGVALGLGFLAKAPMLIVGVVMLGLTAFLLARRGERVRSVMVAGGLFLAIVFGYGAALSRATGWATLGESGSLNYAWHVNRLQKWVHWQGGTSDAGEAWGSRRLAGFARWTEDPPTFGAPVHPTRAEGQEPTVYLFSADRHATYDPYFDPPYWYRGYAHVFRWRYQLIALARNAFHLVMLGRMPFVWGLGIFAFWGWKMGERGRMRRRDATAVALSAGLAILVYLPVHLEERYIAAPLAVLALVLVVRFTPPTPGRFFAAWLVCGVALLGVEMNQAVVWTDMVHGVTFRDNAKWKLGAALRRSGVAPGTQIAVVSFGPSYDCDWAYLAGVEIVGEVASERDEAALVKLAPEAREGVLGRFSEEGAKVVVTRDAVVGELPGWRRVGDVPMWIYELR